MTYDPAQAARSHFLQDVVGKIEDMRQESERALQRVMQADQAPEQVDYLSGRIKEAQRLTERLRAAPGFVVG